MLHKINPFFLFFLLAIAFYVVLWLFFALISLTNPLELHDAARGAAAVVAFIVAIACLCYIDEEKNGKA
jgi:hypothetical protein